MELHKLSDPLEGFDIDFKPKQIYANHSGVHCILIPYKDSRVDMTMLDNICGAHAWQNDFKRDTKGILQGGIGIKCGDEWVWKWSNGTPSEFEKDKGEYSDAFKRAGFMWGIGRCLYDMPFISIILNEDEYLKQEKDGSTYFKVSKYFRPNDWEWIINWGDEYGRGFKLVGTQTTKQGKKVNRYDSNPYNSHKQRP